MKPLNTLLIIIIVLVVVIGFGAFFTVQQSHKALVTRMGRFIKAPGTEKPQVYKPGLHFKWPFIDQVRRFDMRLQTMDVKSSRIITQEQKYVIVDYYVKWRINDLPLFYTSTRGDPGVVENLLQQKINDALRAAFGNRKIMEVVSGERVDVMRKLQKEAKQSAETLGININDVRIKRIDLPTSVSKSVFERMRTEREEVAMLYRSRGRAQAEKIQASADREAAIIKAKAKRKGAKIRAEGTTRAAHVYADAYQKDAKFYAFYRSLNAYEKVFSKNHNIMVLTPNSAFMRYFEQLPNASAKSNTSR